MTNRYIKTLLYVPAFFVWLVLTGCSSSFTATEPILPAPIWESPHVTTVYFNIAGNHTAEYSVASDAYSLLKAEQSAVGGETFFSNIVKRLQPADSRQRRFSSDNPAVSAAMVIPVSRLFYIMGKRQRLVNDGQKLTGIDYTGFSSFGMENYPFGKGVSKVLADKKFRPLTCPLRVYSQEFSKDFAKCPDGNYLFLHSPVIRLDLKQPRIVQTVELLYKENGSVYPYRIVSHLGDVDENNIEKSLYISEVYFILYLLQYLGH